MSIKWAFFLENSTKKISHYFCELRIRSYLWELKKIAIMLGIENLKPNWNEWDSDTTFLEELNYVLAFQTYDQSNKH